MLYASTRLSLLKSLGSTLFTDAIFATSKSDLTPEAYAAHLRHSAAPNPLSKREQEIADLRVSESKTASYEGSRARASHVGTGVGFRWAEELEEALVQLGQSEGSAVVVTVSFSPISMHLDHEISIFSLCRPLIMMRNLYCIILGTLMRILWPLLCLPLIHAMHFLHGHMMMSAILVRSRTYTTHGHP